MSYFPPPYTPLFAHLLFPSSSSSSLCPTFLLLTPLSLLTSSFLPLPPPLYVLLSSSLHPSLCSPPLSFLFLFLLLSMSYFPLLYSPLFDYLLFPSSSSSSLCPTFLLLTTLSLLTSSFLPLPPPLYVILSSSLLPSL